MINSMMKGFYHDHFKLPDYRIRYSGSKWVCLNLVTGRIQGLNVPYSCFLDRYGIKVLI